MYRLQHTSFGLGCIYNTLPCELMIHQPRYTDMQTMKACSLHNSGAKQRRVPLLHAHPARCSVLFGHLYLASWVRRLPVDCLYCCFKHQRCYIRLHKGHTDSGKDTFALGLQIVQYGLISLLIPSNLTSVQSSSLQPWRLLHVKHCLHYLLRQPWRRQPTQSQSPMSRLRMVR